MSTEQGYNGWTNYETWAVGMFLDGNYTGEDTYREVLDIVRSCDTDDTRGTDGGAAYFAANALCEYVEESIGEATDALPNGLATDLLRAALFEVNWRELAESKLAEVVEV